MPKIGDSIPASAVLRHDREKAQEMLSALAESQEAARLAEKVARSERRSDGQIVVTYHEKPKSKNVNWEKQDHLPVGVNPMSSLMAIEPPRRGLVIAKPKKDSKRKK